MQRGSEPLTFLHGDHLNSTVLTTRGGTANGQERYHAYGKDRLATATVPTDNRFTGQKEDGTGLIYMNARYYDPVTGQFVSPDTLVPDATNLFDYNRYMYVRGNPLKYTDPSGHYSVDELMQHFGVDSFDALMALFSERGKYAGNSGWYDILRAAQDGDRVTAIYADQSATLQGTFQRSKDGRITINMNGQAIDDYGFARYGGYVVGGKEAGLASDYGMYHLEGKFGQVWATAASGSRAGLDATSCSNIDCVAIAFDGMNVAGTGLQVAAPLCLEFAAGCFVAGRFVGWTGTVLGVGYGALKAYHGENNSTDRFVSTTLTAMSISATNPKASLVADVVQLSYDLWNGWAGD